MPSAPRAQDERPRALTRLLRLRRREIELTALAVVFVLAAHLLVRIVPFARWHQALESILARPRRHTISATPNQVSHAIARAAKRIPATRCLVQAVAATVLFRICGMQAELHIGARISAKGMEAHAWVAHDNVIRVGWLPDLRSFAPFPLGGRLPL